MTNDEIRECLKRNNRDRNTTQTTKKDETARRIRADITMTTTRIPVSSVAVGDTIQINDGSWQVVERIEDLGGGKIQFWFQKGRAVFCQKNSIMKTETD